MSEEKLTLQIPLSAKGERLDKILRQLHPELSRAQWQRLVRGGCVTIQDEAVRANYKVIGGEAVDAVLPPPEPSEIVPEDLPIDIIYEDDDMLAVNKPAGLVMHPAVGHPNGTLANAIVYLYPDTLNVGGERRPGMVHRLDKDTSGVVLVAKNTAALNHLVAQFKARTTQKEYIALVDGRLQPETALIDAPLGRDPMARKRMAVIEPGRTATSQPSQTRYELNRHYAQHSLVNCFPITGRTHQIRVHLAFIGYPIAGDLIYGRRKRTIELNRHFLHARRITFKRPSDDQEMTLECPLAPELEVVLDQLE